VIVSHWEEVRLGTVTLLVLEPKLSERSAPSLAPPEVSFHLKDFGAPTDLTCTSYPFCTRSPQEQCVSTSDYEFLRQLLMINFKSRQIKALFGFTVCQ
ncbi:unnamed protein product, partial [Larinioides sclopetarius]